MRIPDSIIRLCHSLSLSSASVCSLSLSSLGLAPNPCVRTMLRGRGIFVWSIGKSLRVRKWNFDILHSKRGRKRKKKDIGGIVSEHVTFHYRVRTYRRGRIIIAVSWDQMIVKYRCLSNRKHRDEITIYSGVSERTVILRFPSKVLCLSQSLRVQLVLYRALASLCPL